MPTVTKQREESLRILNRLTEQGIPAGVQQRLGAFLVVWGIFETNLERTIWALNGEAVAGVRPSTEKSSISEWISRLGAGNSKFDHAASAVLKAAAGAARDLLEYRHALAHGCLIPFPSGGLFIRKPSWHHEVRRRESSEAHVDENLLDMAIECAWALCHVLFATAKACEDPSGQATLLELRTNITRAASLANELRHLGALVNHEKY